MFNLDDEDLSGTILGCADGPASFNAEMHRLGRRVISCDPIYRFTEQQLSARIEQACVEIVEQTMKNMGNFVWSSIGSTEELRDTRMSAMQKFLEDYNEGKEQGRYIDAELPILPFDDGSFDIALCSHLLFLYSDRLSLEFHHKSILQLCRVADDVRIFPLIDLDLRRRMFNRLLPASKRMDSRFLSNASRMNSSGEAMKCSGLAESKVLLKRYRK
jgi:hypothetical protein